MLDDDANFTGSGQHAVEPESFRLTLPALVRVQQVDNYDKGKIISAYYTWTVYLDGSVIARFDYYRDPPKSRKAAIAQAKRAARAYALNSKPDRY